MNDNSISKAIVFIENNLYEPIGVGDVAKAVSYSYYHFHRYFQAIMGETIGNYIRTRRLTQAAWDLVHSDKKILDIGISLFFETAESFTRAFKDRYSMPPSAYRKNGIDILLGNRPSEQKSDQTISRYTNLQPEILIIPSTNIMGLRFNTTISGNESISMWQHFDHQIFSRNDPYLFTNNRYGIFETGETCSPDVFSKDSITTAFIGIEIFKNTPRLSGMHIKKLSGGKYARFIHKGTIASLIQTYHYIWGVWFPKSGLQLAPRDDFECYTERFLNSDNKNSEIDIYFPIT